jgi:hypothetical protein
MSSISTEKIFTSTITSNASIQAHLEIIVRNQAEILSKLKGEDEQVLLSAFQFDINNRTQELKSQIITELLNSKK